MLIHLDYTYVHLVTNRKWFLSLVISFEMMSSDLFYCAMHSQTHKHGLPLNAAFSTYIWYV